MYTLIPRALRTVRRTVVSDASLEQISLGFANPCRARLPPSGITAPFQLVEVTLPAGTTVQYEGVSRARPYHRQIWVLEGRIEVSFGADVHRLEKGDCLARDVDGRPSSLSNPLRMRARYAVVIALSVNHANRLSSARGRVAIHVPKISSD